MSYVVDRRQARLLLEAGHPVVVVDMTTERSASWSYAAMRLEGGRFQLSSPGAESWEPYNEYERPNTPDRARHLLMARLLLAMLYAGETCVNGRLQLWRAVPCRACLRRGRTTLLTKPESIREGLGPVCSGRDAARTSYREKARGVDLAAAMRARGLIP